MKAALSAQINKSDRNDARGIAQMMRVVPYRPVHVKTLASQKRRMLLTSRQLLQAKALDIENDLRGTLLPRCRAIFMPQALSHDHLRLWVISTRAASNKVSRIMASPHFEMPPIRSISPDCCRRGVRPKAAPTAFELVKREGTSTVVRNVSATTGPTPGVVISLRQTSSWRTISSRWR